jgi:hypothetical protein
MSVWSAYAEIQRTVPGADLAFSLQDFLHRCSACAQYTIVESAANAVKRTRLARFSSLRLECFSTLILEFGPDPTHPTPLFQGTRCSSGSALAPRGRVLRLLDSLYSLVYTAMAYG